MKLKILSITFLLSILILFSGCSQKEIVYVDREVIVKVPQKCIIKLPNGHIDESLNDSEKLVEILKYISQLHRNIGVCQ
jgi:hypothetical protein